MLHIVLMILKIIGIILLIILGLIAGLILLVLLVPVRYYAKGSFYGKPAGTAKISWLLHIFSFTVIYDSQVTMAFRVFGYRLRSRKKAVKDQTDEIEDDMEDVIVSATEIGKEKIQEETKETAEDQSLRQRSFKKTCAGRSRKSAPPAAIESARSSNPVTRIWNRVKRFFQKLKDLFRRFCDKLKNIKINIKHAKDWFDDPKNKKTIKLLLRQAKRFLRHLLPRKAKGKITFGFDDPYTTGQVLSWFSLIYPVCHKQLQVCPVFDRAVIEGEGSVKGRIRALTLLALALRMVFDKNFRVLLKRFLR